MKRTVYGAAVLLLALPCLGANFLLGGSGIDMTKEDAATLCSMHQEYAGKAIPSCAEKVFELNNEYFDCRPRSPSQLAAADYVPAYFECYAKKQAQRAAEQKREKAAAAEAERRRKAAKEQASRPGARIGMTAAQVINETNWGKPLSVNRTTTARGTREQWVYSSKHFLYFEDGILTAIQD